MKDVLEKWDLMQVTTVALRDDAKNMIKAFTMVGCYILDFHCLNHGLQLVIGDELLEMLSVKNMIGMVKAVVNHAQLSNNFYAELFRYV